MSSLEGRFNGETIAVHIHDLLPRPLIKLIDGDRDGDHDEDGDSDGYDAMNVYGASFNIVPYPALQSRFPTSTYKCCSSSLKLLMVDDSTLAWIYVETYWQMVSIMLNKYENKVEVDN